MHDERTRRQKLKYIDDERNKQEGGDRDGGKSGTPSNSMDMGQRANEDRSRRIVVL